MRPLRGRRAPATGVTLRPVTVIAMVLFPADVVGRDGAVGSDDAVEPVVAELAARFDGEGVPLPGAGPEHAVRAARRAASTAYRVAVPRALAADDITDTRSRSRSTKGQV